jgi:hypothetical protein
MRVQNLSFVRVSARLSGSDEVGHSRPARDCSARADGGGEQERSATTEECATPDSSSIFARIRGSFPYDRKRGFPRGAKIGCWPVREGDMRKLAVFSSAVFALGAAAILLGPTNASAYCSDTGLQGTCPSGQTERICCDEAAPPSPDDPPPDPASGLTLCGQVDDLIGGCIKVGGEDPGPLYVRGCIDGIGAQLPTTPPPVEPPTGPPSTECADHAVAACQDCGCAVTICQ